jgi:hypothetical protein
MNRIPKDKTHRRYICKQHVVISEMKMKKNMKEKENGIGNEEDSSDNL